MSEKIYDVPAGWAKRAWVDDAKYKEMYAHSVQDPNGFWAEHARRLDWMKPFHKVENTSFEPGHISIKWFEDGVLNVAWNCIDRHLEKRGNQTAIIWEGDDPSESKHITYKQLHDEVCKFANILRTRNVKKGDRVTIYLPMIPEAAYAMLACARIGAIHSVVFAGFSPDSLAQRINDCQSKVIITADEGLRGGKKVALKANVDAALAKTSGVDWVVVVKRTGAKVDMNPSRDFWYHEAAKVVTTECPCEHMHAEDPLFILYTSGSTGQPKGVLHTSAGYLLFAAMTHQYVFDYHEGDVYWCTADVGWVTGHSYILYGPLANGATTLMFEGVPNYPDNSRFWNVIDKHKVNIFYTAPTAIRALMQGGDAPVKKTSRASLRLLGSVGEPINPEAWEWYHRVVGDDRCPIVDTWWQTETGGILITPLPGATKLKPGSATRPRSSMPTARCWTARRRAISALPNPGLGRCAPSMAITPASSRPTSRPTRANTSPATAAGAMPTAITGLPAASTMSSMSPAIAWVLPRSRARWSRMRSSRRLPWSAIRTTSRGRASMPMSR
jgi:acetyl-CoA synthetase